MNISKKIEKDLNRLVLKNCYSRVSYFVEDIINVYLNTYNNIFSDLLIEETSLAKPEYFFEDYKNSLQTFNYINIVGGTYIKLIIPSEDNYEFKNRLRFLEFIQFGVIGTYYELPVDYYNDLVSRKDLSKKLLDILYNLSGVLSEDISTSLDFYLLNADYNVNEIFEKILGKKLVIFPFSNFAPVDLFSDGNAYFNSKKDTVISEIVEQSLLDLKRGV